MWKSTRWCWKCGKPPCNSRCGKPPLMLNVWKTTFRLEVWKTTHAHLFPPPIPTHSSTHSWMLFFVTSHFPNQQPSRFSPWIWVKGDHCGRYTYMTLTLSNWTLTPHIHMTSPQARIGIIQGKKIHHLLQCVRTLTYSITTDEAVATDEPSNDGTNRHECGEPSRELK